MKCSPDLGLLNADCFTADLSLDCERKIAEVKVQMKKNHK